MALAFRIIWCYSHKKSFLFVIGLFQKHSEVFLCEVALFHVVVFNRAVCHISLLIASVYPDWVLHPYPLA